jgi:hypothetical protein
MSLSVGRHLAGEFKSVRFVALAGLKAVYSIHSDNQNRFRGPLRVRNKFLAWLEAAGPAVAISESSWLFLGIEMVHVPPSAGLCLAFDRAARGPQTQR